MDAWLLKYRGYLILTLVFAIALGVILYTRRPAPTPIVVVEPTARPTRTVAPLIVHVAGAVLRPDVYSLAPDSRVKDALLVAGGALPEADLDNANLAAPLRDGQRLDIPLRPPTPTPTPSPTVSPTPSPCLGHDGTATCTPPPTATWAPTATSTPLPRATARATAVPSPAGPLDINRASAAELETLPGIGPVLAQRIVDDRTANGPFETIEQLDRVPGIGPALLERLRPYIVVR